MNTSKFVLTVAILVMSASGAHAQSGIKMMNSAYQETPPLPIAPAAGSGFAGYTGNGQRVWDVTAADRTIRGTITRWAASSGWIFNVEHWTVDRDLPITAQTQFQGDFRGAVRSLLASTELTDLPLQPCFHNNSVLRVVPRAELCDRMASNDH